MQKVRINKKFAAIFTAIGLAVLFALVSAFFALPSNFGFVDSSLNAGTARDNERVQMSDLFKRYPSDYVIGPIDAASSDVDPETGKYTYIENDAHKDINGNYTNNIYGIPADQYFDVESYIYTTGVKDSEEGRTLYGWKKDIRAVLGTGSQKGKLAENGKIMSGASVTEDFGIYATFETGQIFGSTEKYVLIVPSDITEIGTGSAAYVYGNKAYYQDHTSGTTVTTSQDYTDFSCFIYSDAIAHYQEPYFWQPRERLAGVYFPDDSRLTTIAGATYTGAPSDSTAWGLNSNGNPINRTNKRLQGKGAFEYCDSLRFLILPNELTSIGKHAFWNCSGIVDMNIPPKVTTIGAFAFGRCTSVRVLPRPATGGNIASSAYNRCSFEDESTVYIMGGAPTLDADGNKVYDNGLSGFIFKKSGNNWEAKGLSGETGEDKNKVFIFPDSADFSENSDRRRGIEYDYIGRDGIKTKNPFPTGGVTSYKIADSFAAGKWCQNVIMPKAVTEIGSLAFSQSHVKYLETYATKIGANAFTGTENNEGDDSGNQWYYFHRASSSVTASSYQIGSGDTAAFVSPASGVTRHIVFEDKAMMDAVGSTITGATGLAPTGRYATHYQIPVYANIYSEDVPTYNGEGVTLVEGDLEERFYYDSDYAAKPDLKQGNNVILYTKRLSGFDFTATKQATGGWVNSGVGTTHSNPTLTHMQSTVWYTDTNYAEKANNGVSGLYNSSTSTSVNIYTKNIAANAKIETKTYDFGTAYDGLGTLTDDPGNDSTAGSFAFNASLGLTSDYASAITAFVYPNGSALNPAATYVKNVRHAGTYTFSIGLDTKWGVWKGDYNAENREATVTVERQKFDLTSLDKVPEFKTSDGSSLRGDNTTLYRYNDGWYLTQRNGEEPNASVVVTNAYVYDTGAEMTLALTGFNGNDEKSAYGYLMSTNSYPAKGPGEYYTTYTLGVKYIEGAPGQTDYEFYYGAADDDSRFGDLYDDALGLRLDRKTAASARVNKRWYIVTETNYFIDAAETTPDETTAPYVPVSLNGDPVYSWAYESAISVKTPRLMYNMNCVGNDTVGTEVVPTIEISYTPAVGSMVVIKTVDDDKPLSYYINSAMPVGSYTITVYGGGVRAYFGEDEYKTYQPVSGTYVLNVLPAKLNSAAVKAIDTALKGTQEIKNNDGEVIGYYNAYPSDVNNKKLHDTLALSDINDTLNTARRAAGEETNYWAADANKSYYDGEVTLAYNLEGSGNTTYVNYATVLSMLVSADEYTLYYSISAKNYDTYGGEGDSARRDKTFTTVLYTDMKVSEVYDTIAAVGVPYFKNVVYTGEAAHTLVPSSQYYVAEFNDSDYIDVREKATVTLVLNTAKPARWTFDYNDAFTEDMAAKYFDMDDDGNLVVYFDIVAAQNSWYVAPQMPSWTFNAFDANINSITAGLNFTGITVGGRQYGADVKYALIPEGYDTDVAFDDPTAATDGVVFFVVDEEGKVDEITAVKLNSLKPGKYYLKSYVADLYSDGTTTLNEAQTNVIDINGFTHIATNAAGAKIATVTVSKAANSWTSTPNVMQWKYGEYDADRHHITAVSDYPTRMPEYNGVVTEDFGGYTFNGSDELPQVMFTIYKRTKGNDNKIVDTLVIDTFAAGSDVSAQLKNLGAGTYALATSMAGSDYYLGIAETRIEFEIRKSDNSWDKQPAITSFVYKQFSADNNFIAGDPHYPVDEKKVHYVISTSSSIIAPVTTLEAFEALVGVHFTSLSSAATEMDGEGNTTDLDMTAADYLNTLPVLESGSYYFAVFAEPGDDYMHLFHYGSFGISGSGNNWVNGDSPDVSGWTYGKFGTEGTLNGAEAEHGEVKYTVYVAVDGNATTEVAMIGEDKLENLTFAELSDIIEDLGAGSYSLFATSGATSDYSAVTFSKLFTVAKAANAWESAPFISGWTVGEDADDPDNGTVKNESEDAEISGAYYYATTNSSGTPVADYNRGALENKPTNAGNYAYVLTVEETDNYLGFTTTLFFTIEQANNEWAPSPAGTYNWVWGENITTKVANITGAKATNGTIGYAVAYSDGTPYIVDWEQDGVTITSVLNDLPVGSYKITVSVDAEANYKVVAPAVAYITVSAATLSVTDPVCAGWTWGSAAGNEFTGVTVSTVKESDADEVGVLYSIPNSDRDPESYDTFVEYLKGLGAGSYTARVTVTCPNYTSVTKTVTFTVEHANMVWSGTPVAADWTWNDKDDSEKTLGNDLTATLVDGRKATLKYEVYDRVLVYSCDTYSKLKDWLFGADWGNYTVYIVATSRDEEGNNDDDNYVEATLEQSYTVSIAAAKNSWLSAPNNLSRLYQTELENVKAPLSLFGKVVIKYNNLTVTDSEQEDYEAAFIAWVNDEEKSAKTYTFTVTVQADENGNYNGYNETRTLTVVGMGGSWDNFDQLSNSVTFTYNEETFKSDMGNVEIPYKSPNAALTEKITYKIKYVPWMGDEVNSGDLVGDEEVDAFTKATSWLKRYGAGTYTVEAIYDVDDDNYSDLYYSLTITVNKASISWIAQDWKYDIGSSEGYAYNGYQRAYQAFGNVPTPSAGAGHEVVYIVNKSGEEGEIVQITDLADYLNGLSVGTYYIRYRILPTNNYTGLIGENEISIMVIVNQAAIQWSNLADLDVRYDKFVDDADYGIVVPISPRGTVTLTLTTTAEMTYSGELNSAAVNTWLHSLLAARSEGYKLVFSVQGTNNYNSLNHTTYLYLGKHANSATKLELSATSIYYGEKVTVTTKPTFTFGDDDDENENVVYTMNRTNYKYSELVDYLDNTVLSVGTYTITASVAETDTYLGAQSTVTLTVDKFATAWTADSLTALNAAKGSSYNYGDTTNLPIPEATWGTVSYYYIVGGVPTKIESGNWNNYLTGKTVGTYIVAAGVTGDNNHDGVDLFEITVTISSAGISWSAETQNAPKYVVWDWNKAKTPEIKKPTVVGNGCEVKFKLTGDGFDEAAEYREDEWSTLYARLTSLPAGSYTLTASVGGSNNYSLPPDLVYTVIINNVTVTWSDETRDAQKNLSWTWDGDYKGEIVTPALVGADDNVKLVYTFKKDDVVVDSTNTEWDWESIIAAIRVGEVGTYTVTVTPVVEDEAIKGNYSIPTEITFTFDIATRTVNWTNDTLSSDKNVTWTWNKDHDYDSDEIVIPELTDDKSCKVVFALDGESDTTDWEWSDVINALERKGAGTYTLTVTVEGGSGVATPQVLTYTFTINEQPVDWKPATTTAAAKDYTWTWDGEQNGYDEIAPPELDNKDGGTPWYVLSKVSLSRSGTTILESSDWGKICEELNKQDAGTYNITVTADAASNNYEMPPDLVYTVTIEKIVVGWTIDNKAITQEELNRQYGSISVVYDSFGDVLPELKATYDRTVKFYLVENGEDNEVADWNEKIKTLAASSTPYVLKAVAEGNNNYTELLFTIDLTISKKPVDWSDATKAASKDFEWTWSTDKTYQTVNAPTLNDSACTVAFAYDKDGSLTSWDDILSEIKNYGVVGEYKITATAVMTSNHVLADGVAETLEYTITIKEQEVAWKPETIVTTAFRWTWGETYDNVREPELDSTDGCKVVFMIDDTPYATWALAMGEIKKQGKGTYTIVATPTVDPATNAGNYKLPDAPVEYTFEIAEKVINWTDTTLGADKNYNDWIWNAGHKYDEVAAPEHNGDENLRVKYTLTGGGVFYAWLDNGATKGVFSALISKGVGTYTIVAEVEVVEAKPNDSYSLPKELTYTFTINAQPVDWKPATTTAAAKDYTWTWNSEKNGYDKITVPELENAAGGTISYTITGDSDMYTVWDDVYNLLIGKPAGTYVITATATANDNYSIVTSKLTYTVTIKLAANEWISHVGKNVEIVFGHNEYTDNGAQKSVAYQAKYNNDDGMQIRIDGTLKDKDTLNYEIEHLPVGSHTIVVTVAPTATHEGLNETIILTVTKAKNRFTEDLAVNGWVWDDVTRKTGNWAAAWTYITAPVPEIGSSVIITVKSKTVENGETKLTTVIEHTLTYLAGQVVNENDLNALKSKLLALDVGTYTIEAEIPMSDSYEKLTSDPIEFNITKAINEWEGEGKPTIGGWDFKGEIANPTSNPKYGKNTVIYKYAKIKEGDESDSVKQPANHSDYKWSDATSTAAGTYWLYAEVPGTDNYEKLVGYAKFSVNAGQNAWVNEPGVIAWEWNGYNRDRNLLSGSAKNDGIATFRIFAGKSGIGNNRNLDGDDFVNPSSEALPSLGKAVGTFFSDDGFNYENHNAEVKVVSEDVAKWLNALKPGPYVLRVDIPGGDNLDSLFKSIEFTVDKATNSWSTAPAVSSFVFNGFVKTGEGHTFTYGVPTYGGESAVVYKLNDTTYRTDADKSSYAKVSDAIEELGVGRYTLYAWVEAGDNYKALYDKDAPYQVREFTVSSKGNGWTSALPDNVNEYYSDLHVINNEQEDTFEDVFKALFPEVKAGTDVVYEVFKGGSVVISVDGESELDYDTLVSELKELGPGEYNIKITAQESTNFTEIIEYRSLTIRQYVSQFTTLPDTDTLSAQWQQKVTDDGTEVTDTVLLTAEDDIVAEYGEMIGSVFSAENTVEYKFVYLSIAYSYSDFKNIVVKSLSAGTYQVVLRVVEDNVYAGAEYPIRLVVEKATNEWTNEGGLTATLSEGTAVFAEGDDEVIASWNWDSTVTWSPAETMYGDIIYVAVRYRDETTYLRRITVDYSAKDGGEGAVKSVGEYISNLDAGEYTLVLDAPSTTNWDSISATLDFDITPAPNYWKSGYPFISGSGVVEGDYGSYSWTYGMDAVVRADSKHGTAVYEYLDENGDPILDGNGDPIKVMPTDAGTYSVVVSVPVSNNYDEVEETTLDFVIMKASDRSFTDPPSAAGWIWDQYDPKLNTFTGTPRVTGATVTFSVGMGTGNDFTPISSVLTNFSLASDGIVDDVNVIKALNALTGGTSAESNTTRYTLRVTVSDTPNYLGFATDVTFLVTGATNTWTTVPSIATWPVNNWTETSLPSAESKYGAPKITITGISDGIVYFTGEYVKDKDGKYVLDKNTLFNDLNLAGPGWYEMVTEVEAVEGQYNNDLVSTQRFQIFIKGQDGSVNYWEELPTIRGWNANIDGVYSAIVGKPFRGLPNFEFYKMNDDGTQGDKIDATSKAYVLIKKGTMYENDIYVPVEDGDYVMIATSKGTPTEPGTTDSPDVSKTYFTIDKRPISFEEEPRIETLLYLGDRDNWALPTAKASLEDAEISYVYTNVETGESYKKLSDITQPGKYTVTAYAWADYTLTIHKSVDFAVELSSNKWVTKPTIKDWSEEFGPSDIEGGVALVGSDKIKYWYSTEADPTTPLPEKPTTEGTYILHAEVILKGYEDLIEEITFTIEPAYDMDLIIVDLVFGLVACAFAVVAIIFAIRRYKEN